MSEINTQVLQDGQLAIRTVVQNGAIVSGTSSTDITALVQTNEGKQLALKTVLVNGGTTKPEYVAQLPEPGEEGVLYLVNTGTTRDGYAIFQMFVWKANDEEYVAIGAYDVGIDPDGIVYERSFDTTTHTMTVTVGQEGHGSSPSHWAPILATYTGITGTTVTIADTSSASLVKIYKNGILLEPTADYSISGTTLTMTTALVSTDKVTTEVF